MFHTRLGSFGRGVDRDIRRNRRLVGSRNPSELRDLPGEGLLVHSLDVSLNENVEWTRHVYFGESRDASAQRVAAGAIWRDGGGDGDHAVAREQFTEEPDSPNILFPVLPTESEVAAEVRPHHVTVEQLHSETPPAEAGRQHRCQSALAAAG